MPSWMSLWTNSRQGIPLASQSLGYMLMFVNPGIVFSSFTRTLPSWLDEEVDPRHPFPEQGNEASHGKIPDLRGHIFGQVGRNLQVRAFRVAVLGIIGVESHACSRG